MSHSAAFAELNPGQLSAVGAPTPLLIIAGAGTGKTTTLAHRVARLILDGADPKRILLLTFTRRAADDMSRRTRSIVAHALTAAAQGRTRPAAAAELAWAGTFHAAANRLLRLHAEEIGLDPAFTVLDRSDAADLIDVLRHELGLSRTERRFPQKSTCLSIYSRVTNAQEPLQRALDEHFPWCRDFTDELRRLFAAYVEAKQRSALLDYDDLLLYWYHLMSDEGLAARVRRRFDHVLVDEYQDTNALQAEILKRLAPSGAGLTVVGDDAQAIYAFRAATVRNILDFPAQFAPPATMVTLEHNYRSTQPILDAANAVIGLSRERFTKNLYSRRVSEERPRLVTVDDEAAQVDYVVERVLAHREEGIPLKNQAVLFRAAHHSDALEVELSRRNIPFVKFGGLKFLEAAHVKDLVSVLRWGENPRDRVAAFRVLKLLPGVGPSTAQRLFSALELGGFSPEALQGETPPAGARADWPGLCALWRTLRAKDAGWPAQVGAVRAWYLPHLERLYDHAAVRALDLDQLEQIAAQFPSRERFLSDVTLDPPQATGDFAAPPHLDEDFLILSTIHSAKGQEWDSVFVLNAVDGCIPSDLATSTPEQIDEERRLFYVALTRARDHLHVMEPLRFYVHNQPPRGDRHLYAPRTRFLPEETLARFERVTWGTRANDADASIAGAAPGQSAQIDIAARLRAAWS